MQAVDTSQGKELAEYLKNSNLKRMHLPQKVHLPAELFVKYLDGCWTRQPQKRIHMSMYHYDEAQLDTRKFPNLAHHVHHGMFLSEIINGNVKKIKINRK